VPTPSVPDTSTGSRYLPDRSNSAPKPPRLPMTSGRKLRLTSGLMRSTTWLPASMSTPASRYVRGVGAVTAGSAARGTGILTVAGGAATAIVAGIQWTCRARCGTISSETASGMTMGSAIGVAIGRLKRSVRPLVWAAVLALASFSASAQRTEGDRVKTEGVYSAEITVNGQGEAERRIGFSRALVQVLAKLTGDNRGAARPGVGAEIREAGDDVSGYDYPQD